MKKVMVSALVVTLALLVMPIQSVGAQTLQVSVTIPSFNVTINGKVMDSENDLYPFIVYKGITYMPLTYRMNQFAGLKYEYFDNDYTQNTRFIGIDNRTSGEYVKHDATSANKGNYKAEALDGSVAANSNNIADFYNNASQEYPLLRFRDIVYIPLTWALAVRTLGWKYNFSSEGGLVIDTTQRTRPIIDLGSFQGGPGGGIGKTSYLIGEASYVGYPDTTLGDNYNFYVMFYGKQEVVFDLRNQLSDADYYMNCTLDTNGYINPVHIIAPTINSNIFTILSVKQSASGAKENLLLKIDMTTGKIISSDIIPPKQAA